MELLQVLDQCDLSNSHNGSMCSTPCVSPCLGGGLNNPALLQAARLKASNLAFLNQNQSAQNND